MGKINEIFFPDFPHYNAKVRAGEGRLPGEPDIVGINLFQDIVQRYLVWNLTVLQDVLEARGGA